VPSSDRAYFHSKSDLLRSDTAGGIIRLMDEVRLRQRTKRFGESIKNVRGEELFAFLDNQVQPFCRAHGLNYDHRNRGGSHHVFTVATSTFTIAKALGTPLLRPVYVRLFLEAMSEIGLYEQE